MAIRSIMVDTETGPDKRGWRRLVEISGARCSQSMGVWALSRDCVSAECGAVSQIEEGFPQIWAMMGAAILESELSSDDNNVAVGNMDMRVVASLPATAGMIRSDGLVAALARNTLWLTDAYYAATTSYVQALRVAAMNGVDVRLLVPDGTDIPILRPLSKAGYRPRLEAGLRVFEWKGTMLHARTAVPTDVGAGRFHQSEYRKLVE